MLQHLVLISWPYSWPQQQLWHHKWCTRQVSNNESCYLLLLRMFTNGRSFWSLSNSIFLTLFPFFSDLKHAWVYGRDLCTETHHNLLDANIYEHMLVIQVQRYTSSAGAILQYYNHHVIIMVHDIKYHSHCHYCAICSTSQNVTTRNVKFSQECNHNQCLCSCWPQYWYHCITMWSKAQVCISW